MEQSKLFPESPGLYLAQRNTDIVLFKLTGMYPTLIVGKSIYLTNFIEGNSLTEVPKEVLANMVVFPEKWSFIMIGNLINMDVFPKLAFKCNSDLDLSTDELLHIRSMYYRLVQSGIAPTKILKALSYEYKLTMTQVIDLANKFDKDANSSHIRQILFILQIARSL